jgi:hypothetical protein
MPFNKDQLTRLDVTAIAVVAVALFSFVAYLGFIFFFKQYQPGLAGLMSQYSDIITPTFLLLGVMLFCAILAPSRSKQKATNR